MSDEQDAEDHILAEVVPPEDVFSLDEERRHFVLQHGAPYLANLAGEHTLPIEDVIKVLAALEKWLLDGVTPIDPKAKFKVMRHPNATGR